MALSEIAIVVTVVLTLAMAGLLGVAAMSLLRSSRALTEATRTFAADSAGLAARFADIADQAESQLAHADVVLNEAQTASDAVNSATRLASKVARKPLIKAMSLGAGTAKTAQQLRSTDKRT